LRRPKLYSRLKIGFAFGTGDIAPNISVCMKRVEY